MEGLATTAVHGTSHFMIVEQSEDLVVGTMPVQSGILNPHGVVHAGALLWFADVCATVLAISRAERGPGGSGFPHVPAKAELRDEDPGASSGVRSQMTEAKTRRGP